MTRHDDFGRAVRSGRRAGRPTVVAHLSAGGPVASETGEAPGAAVVPGTAEPARVGLVVSKAVGNAVVRNRVSRRLRHQMSTRVDRLAPGSLLVLRAQPAAAAAGSAELGADLDRVLDRLLSPRTGSEGSGSERSGRAALRPHPGPEARR